MFSLLRGARRVGGRRTLWRTEIVMSDVLYSSFKRIFKSTTIIMKIAMVAK